MAEATACSAFEGTGCIVGSDTGGLFGASEEDGDGGPGDALSDIISEESADASDCGEDRDHGDDAFAFEHQVIVRVVGEKRMLILVTSGGIALYVTRSTIEAVRFSKNAFRMTGAP